MEPVLQAIIARSVLLILDNVLLVLFHLRPEIQLLQTVLLVLLVLIVRRLVYQQLKVLAQLDITVKQVLKLNTQSHIVRQVRDVLQVQQHQ